MWYKIYENIIDFRYDSSNQTTGLSAAEHAILQIIKNYPPPYYLMCSGGVDSQAMLYAWHLFGKDFVPITMIYDKNHKFNSHDIKTIIEFSEKYKITINFQDFDLLNFYKNDYDKIANYFECSSPQISAHISMTQNLKGTVIFSGTWLGKTTAFYNRVQHALTLYSKTRPCIPFFFLCDPDLAYTGIKNIVNPVGHLPGDIYNAKCKEYTDAGFPVIPQSKKMTGFELVKDYYDNNYWHLATPKMRLKYNSKASKRTFDILLRYPYEEIFPHIEYKFVYNDC